MSAQKNEIADFFLNERAKLVNFVNTKLSEMSDYDSEDIVQDVMVNLFDKTDFTAPIENVSAYIYRSLRNRIIDLVRKRKNDVSIDENLVDNKDLKLSDILHDVRYNVDHQLEKKELTNKLYASIDKLNENDKAIVIATEFENSSFRELSEEWGVPIGTLLARKNRAIKKLKRIINELL